MEYVRNPAEYREDRKYFQECKEKAEKILVDEENGKKIMMVDVSVIEEVIRYCEEALDKLTVISQTLKTETKREEYNMIEQNIINLKREVEEKFPKII